MEKLEDPSIPSLMINGSDLPDRGTKTGLIMGSYGADVTDDATNRIAGIADATRSDSADECHSPNLKGRA